MLVENIKILVLGMSIQEVDALYGDVQTMLANSPLYDAELFIIHDYEGFGSVFIDKYTSLEEVSSLASVIVFIYEQDITTYKHWRKIFQPEVDWS